MANWRWSGDLFRAFALAAVVSGCSTSMSASVDGASLAGLPSIASAGTSPQVGGLDRRAFYTITTTVDGEVRALTFIVPEGVEPGTLTTNPSLARVDLLPPTAAPTQLWQPSPVDVNPGDVYLLYTKVSDHTDDLTGILELVNPDNEFSESPAYAAEYNRVTVGYAQNENVEYWILKRQADGRYRILSVLSAELNSPNDTQFKTRWNEARALSAAKGPDGRVMLRHEPPGDGPGQLWTLTKVAY